MNSTDDYIEVELHAHEKKLILELAGFWVMDETTLADFRNQEKEWVRCKPYLVSELIGELSYHYNRCRSAAKSELLDALIIHLESALLP